MAFLESYNPSEEKIAVGFDHDNGSSSSDYVDSIMTPSSTSSSDHLNTDEMDGARFIDSIPEPTSNTRQVREWIQRWFSERDLHHISIGKRIDKLHWNGKDIRRESKAILEAEFTTLGFKLYARSLADEIMEARSIAETFKQTQNEESGPFQEVKQFIENKFEEREKEDVNEHDYGLNTLRYFVLFSLLILAKISLFWKLLYFSFLLTGLYQFLKAVTKSLTKAALSIEEKRRTEDNGALNRQNSSVLHFKPTAIKMEQDQDPTIENYPWLKAINTKQEESSAFFGKDLDWKKKFLGIWKIWFLLEIFCYFLDWELTRTLSVFLATCLFCMSNEGIYLIVSGVRDHKKKMIEIEGKRIKGDPNLK